MNKAQGPNETVPQDPPTPQAATQIPQVHQGPQAVVCTVMSYYFLSWTRMVNYCPDKAISPLELKFDGRQIT